MQLKHRIPHVGPRTAFSLAAAILAVAGALAAVGPAPTFSGAGEGGLLGLGDSPGSHDRCPDPCLAAGLQLPVPGLGTTPVKTAAYTIYGPAYSGPEPTIGITPDGGTVYLQALTNTLRSTDGGASWVEIAPVYMNQVTSDPMMYYDPVIDRLYVLHMVEVACFILAWTDSPGVVSAAAVGTASWHVNPVSCMPPAVDHPKLEGGPSPTYGVANEGRALYLGYSQIGGGAMVTKSLDGGRSWLPVHGTHSVARGTVAWPTGPVTADPAGTYVYLPHHTPTSGLMVAHSNNEGLFYGTHTASTSAGASGHAVDPEVAVDASGNAYAVWYSDTDHQIYYAYSTDHGVTWSSATRISDNTDTLTTVWPTAVANSTGGMSVAYLGTTNSSAGPNGCAATGSSRCVWYLYQATVTSANSGSPTITRTRVSPLSDPVQIGRICIDGLDCTSGRNLLDFIDIELDGAGYSHIAYADGCLTGCGPTTTGQTTGSQVRYARQTSGTTV